MTLSGPAGKPSRPTHRSRAAGWRFGILAASIMCGIAPFIVAAPIAAQSRDSRDQSLDTMERDLKELEEGQAATARDEAAKAAAARRAAQVNQAAFDRDLARFRASAKMPKWIGEHVCREQLLDMISCGYHIERIVGGQVQVRYTDPGRPGERVRVYDALGFSHDETTVAPIPPTDHLTWMSADSLGSAKFVTPLMIETECSRIAGAGSAMASYIGTSSLFVALAKATCAMAGSLGTLNQ